ncbi:MAG: tetratricopeptide repeat protein, partial [Armatimonadetes bacterium]|nr:tetratricopeptide repeat protein [Armatimonadota bacterium]
AVADLLYETLKLYEKGRLQAAFNKCRQALRLNPDSPSGHSLIGLIYERKAEEQIARGAFVDAEDYLHAAMRQMERVLEENPDSVADREKLEELRAKLADMGGFEIDRPGVFARLRAIAKRAPFPWTAGAGAFAFVFVVLFLGLNGSRSDREVQKPAQVAQPQQPAQQPQSAPSQTLPRPTYPAWTYQPPPKLYPAQPQPDYGRQPTPAASPRSAPPLTPYPVQQPPSNAPSADSVAAPQLPVLPVPAKAEPPEPQPPKVPERPASERARTALSSGDYQSASILYQEAISQGEDTPENHQSLGMALYNLGRKSSAAGHFERAIQLYQDRKARGIDVNAAESGIRTCKMYVELSKE